MQRARAFIRIAAWRNAKAAIKTGNANNKYGSTAS